jgi:predicted Zn-dependent protease
MYGFQRALIAAMGGLYLALPALGWLAQAKPTSPLAEPIDSEISQLKSTKAKPNLYKQAEQELPADYYVLYRVIERLARANGLDKTPWRVYISPKYDINAYATEVNKLAFFSGLLDMLDGDNNAIACVAGHEMAHHTQNHIPVSTAQRQQIVQQLRQEAIQEVAAEQKDLREDLQRMNVGGWVTGQAVSLGSLIRGSGGIPIFFGNILGAVLQGQRQRRLEDAVKRIDQIAAEKEASIRQQWKDLSHRHEHEADKFGYQYMVRAGFKPEGCITVMTVLNRLPQSLMPSETHPAPSDRIATLQVLGSQYPTATLVAEGRKYLAASPKPLTYNLSRDGVSLRINSKSGSNKGGFPE